MQDFDQQNHYINNYLESIGNPDKLVFEEQISGSADFEKRKLHDILNMAKEGDTIIVSELSRLGRKLSNVILFVSECLKKGISVITAKDGTHLTNGINGKIYTTVLSLASEIELHFLKERCRGSLREKIDYWDNLPDGEIYVSKSGRQYVKGSGESPFIKRNKLTDEQKELIREKRRASKLTGEWLDIYTIAKDMRIRGDSYDVIADTLNSLGKKSTRGRDFKAMSVKRLIDKGF